MAALGERVGEVWGTTILAKDEHLDEEEQGIRTRVGQDLQPLDDKVEVEDTAYERIVAQRGRHQDGAIPRSTAVKMSDRYRSAARGR